MKIVDERTRHILSKQTIPPAYGVSPGMQAIADIKAFHAFPLAVQQQAAADLAAELLKGNTDE